jgi:hypothetical protein
MAMKSQSQAWENQMAKALRQEHIRGTVTHVHDRRTATLNIFICIACQGDDEPESLPITYSITPTHEQGDLPEIAASVMVGDEVDSWYVAPSDDSPIHLKGQTLQIIS